MVVFNMFGLPLLMLISIPEAHAYLDMGTGSYIIQGLLAGAFAGIYAVKAYWLRIRIFLSKFFGKDKGEQ